MATACPSCRTITEDRVPFCSKCGYQFATNPAADVKPGPKAGKIVGIGCLGLFGIVVLFGILSPRSTAPTPIAPTPDLPGPPVSLAAHVTITSFEPDGDGFGNILTATFTIKNFNDVRVRDIGIECAMFAPSGTRLGTAKHTIYEIIPANKSRTFHKVNLGFLDPQVKNARCDVVSVAE